MREAIEAPAPDPAHGALLFHQWAASLLPPRVRDTWGYRLVGTATPLLNADTYLTATVLRDRLDKADYRDRVDRFRLERKRRRKWGLRIKPGERDPLKLLPTPKVQLACPGCRCAREAKADCLAARFRFAYGLVTGRRLAMRYFAIADTRPNDARDLRAFMRAASPSDPIAREAYGNIIAREDGLLVVPGERTGQTTAALRDAFALTAVAAVRESCDLLVNASAARVAPKFRISPLTLERRRHDLDPEARNGFRAE